MLVKTEAQEKLAEKEEKSAQKEEKKAEKTGLGKAALQKILRGETKALQEEMDTSRKIFVAEEAETKETKAQQVERLTDKDEDKAQREEVHVEKEDAELKFKKAARDEAKAEKDEKISDSDEVSAEVVEKKAENKLASKTAIPTVAKLYDMEGANIPEAPSRFTVFSVLTMGFGVVGFGVVGYRTVTRPSRHRAHHFMPVQADVDGYDSEAPAE